MVVKESPEPGDVQGETRHERHTTSPSYSPPQSPEPGEMREETQQKRDGISRAYSPRHAPRSGSVTPTAALDAQARPEQPHSTELTSPSSSPELQSTVPTPRQRRREKAREASTDDDKRSPEQNPMPNDYTGGDTITASSRPALRRSTASLGKRCSSDNGNPEDASPSKKRSLVGIKNDDEMYGQGLDTETYISNFLQSINQTLAPPVPQRRLRCTQCECWDHYCSLEDNPYASSPCTTCDRKKQYCVEGRFGAANWHQSQMAAKAKEEKDPDEMKMAGF